MPVQPQKDRLSQEEVQEERTRLERELTEARAELAEIEKRLEYRGDYSLGEGDPAIHTWEVNFALGERLREKVESMRAALQRIEEGTYGICQRCGARIDRARLEIIPHARFCIGCAREEGK
jgi:RNA polymerase-binding transcription factor DksA